MMLYLKFIIDLAYVFFCKSFQFQNTCT